MTWRFVALTRGHLCKRGNGGGGQVVRGQIGRQTAVIWDRGGRKKGIGVRGGGRRPQVEGEGVWDMCET